MRRDDQRNVTPASRQRARPGRKIAEGVGVEHIDRREERGPEHSRHGDAEPER